MIDLKLLGLNPVQENAVSHTEGPTLVIAGAGTGKTRVLTARIIYLTQNLGFDPFRILAITFTNKAAQEMKNRIKKYLPNTDFPYIHTFHAFSLRLLREEIHLLGFSNNFHIIDEIEQKNIVNEIYRLNKLDKTILNIKNALYYIDAIKSANDNPDDFVSLIKTKEKLTVEQCEIIKSVFKNYQNYLKKQNLVDFNDLLNFTYKILLSHPEVCQKWASRFDYILIDEFQDTNEIQYEIVDMLAQKHKNIFAVGDPDQSIYSWRGADAAIIEKFQDAYEDVKTFVLEENYRSSQQILNVANDLIANNHARNKKQLKSTRTNGNVVKYYIASSQDLESIWICKRIKELADKGVRYEDIVILYRSNSWSRNLEHALIQSKIPYYIYGGFKFYQRKEIKDLISYLKVISSKDEVSLKRIINVPARKVSEESIDLINDYAIKNNMKFYDALKDIDNIDIYKPARKNILDLYYQLENWRQKPNTKISLLLKDILEKTNYLKQFDPTDEKDRHDNIDELIASVQTYEQSNSEASLNDYLQDIQLYTASDEKHQRNSVRLMTIHLAKGLEFDYVYVSGLVEGIFPAFKSINDQNEKGLLEERRVFYVAITRAKKELTITTSLGFNFDNSAREVSRFMNEIKNEHLNTIGSQYIPTYNPNKNNLKSWDYDNSWYDSRLPRKYNESKTPIPDFYEGEVVVHTIFGEGVILAVLNRTVKIAFSPKYGVKEILSVSPTLIRRLK
ncbi:ATP-dependent helicase [[Mycoplasma] testudinis]|uniref:ATP-dependent helicase n=1 Tax=[Mycoplasma] testudinis TaxID=33924 RepID=UPI00056118C2|nr:UvrD-helicase domain-containing protein [[Mycoplasma] testudinis]